MTLHSWSTRARRGLAKRSRFSLFVALATASMAGGQACSSTAAKFRSDSDAAAGARAGAPASTSQGSGGAAGQTTGESSASVGGAPDPGTRTTTIDASAAGGSTTTSDAAAAGGNAGSGGRAGSSTGPTTTTSDAAVADVATGGGGTAGSVSSGSGGVKQDAAGKADATGGATPGSGGTSGNGTGSGTGSSADGGTLAPEPLWPDIAGTLNLPECDDGGLPLGTLRVNPSTPIDYIAVCETLSYIPGGDGGTNVSYQVIEQSGTPCKGATDAGACAAQLAAVANNIKLQQECWGPPIGCQHFVVTTAGGTVRVYLPSDYKTLLGTIDTADEARLLTNQMIFGGWQVQSCGSIRATANGFDVVATRLENDCRPIVEMRDQLHVASDGTVTVVRSNVFSVSPGACI